MMDIPTEAGDKPRSSRVREPGKEDVGCGKFDGSPRRFLARG